jgi:hypothetical protein
LRNQELKVELVGGIWKYRVHICIPGEHEMWLIFNPHQPIRTGHILKNLAKFLSEVSKGNGDLTLKFSLLRTSACLN